ncbi:MAG: copper homeostasis protein CutC [Armatimonadota bacterium]
MPRILLETIVTSLDDARAAAAGSADRFELCSAMPLGGLTPTLGTLGAIKAELDVPVMCMIRPREGGMAYSEGELAAMERDLEHALAAGADGIVFGILTEAAQVDLPRCRRFLARVERAAGGRAVQTVFHRAFDITADPARALEELIDLGVTRVLTSGRAPDAIDGLDEIRCTVEQAAGRIQVLPGGGIRLDNVAEVVRRTGVDQVHLYVTRDREDRSALANPRIRFGMDAPPDEVRLRLADEAAIRALRARLDVLGDNA